jgi:hypothetical protein
LVDAEIFQAINRLAIGYSPNVPDFNNRKVRCLSYNLCPRRPLQGHP